MLLAVSGCAIVAAAAPASAQYHDRNRNVSVRERPQPGYDPIGIPIGAFRGYATLPIGVLYTDNVFATPTGEEDMIITIRPSAEIRSQWSRHQLTAYGNYEQFSFQDFEDEDRTNMNLGGNGRIDIQRGFSFSLNGNLGWLEESRTDASAPPNTLSPVEYDTRNFGAYTSKEFNRLRLSGGANFYDADYEDAVLLDGVTPVEQDDRDHEAVNVNARADFALTPTTAIFASAAASDRSYDLQPPAVGFTRDAEGQTYSLGANFDITNLVRGEIALGYLTEDFAEVSAGDVDGLAASARVEWFPTPLATFEFSAQRAVTDTGVVGAVGSLTTTLAARVDYELQRNIIVTGQVSHRDDEYEGILRDDMGLAAAVDVLYLINEHVGASVSVQHSERESDGAQQGVEFDQGSVGLNLVLRY